LLVVLALGCTDRVVSPDESFAFAVLDVGQGLSQVGVRNGRAVVWDLGPGTSHERWSSGYDRLGRPCIEAVVISHCDEDHWGGLRLLDSTCSFSGLVIVNHVADTALLRGSNAFWGPRLRFRHVAQADTLGLLDGVEIECLWPPSDPRTSFAVEPEQRNANSLAFRITYGHTCVLITSDIDTVAEAELSRKYAWTLKSELLVAAHHGSSSGVDRRFYGYVDPAVCFVSCGADNDFGHPSAELLDLLWEMNIRMASTATEGHMVARSSGHYWGLEFLNGR